MTGIFLLKQSPKKNLKRRKKHTNNITITHTTCQDPCNLSARTTVSIFSSITTEADTVSSAHQSCDNSEFIDGVTHAYTEKNLSGYKVVFCVPLRVWLCLTIKATSEIESDMLASTVHFGYIQYSTLHCSPSKATEGF